MKRMNPLLLTIVILVAIFSSNHVIQTQAKKLKTQTQALTNLYKTKQQNNNVYDNSLIDVDDALATLELDNDEDGTIVGSQEEMQDKDKIEKLPGQPSYVEFDHYAGYVTTNSSAGRALFYYFVQGHYHAKHSLPLLLWLNGGPGCSSLAYGAMQELGPFRVHSDGKTLFENRYAWNHAANVLFLESPAGVGFSYSNTSSDYSNSGDQYTAAENLIFLLNWFERFPEFKGADFYLSGESYAGHYVPQLAHAILSHNKKANKLIINLKGIIIGNAVINDETDMKGMYDFWTTHAIVSDETNNQVDKYCDFSPNSTNQTKECDTATEEAGKNLYYLDIYNIYAPLCLNSNLTAKPQKISIKNFDPCSDNYVHAYFNRPDVQAALHANVTKLTHDWELCSDVITDWKDSPATVIPLLQEFMENGLRVWIFSGDTDGRVPVTSTKYSIEQMKLPIKTPWHAWLLDGEVGGYVQEYKGDITFVTVRGAGHQVPSYQPVRALSLIKHFLNGTPLPGPTFSS